MKDKFFEYIIFGCQIFFLSLRQLKSAILISQGLRYLMGSQHLIPSLFSRLGHVNFLRLLERLSLRQ